MSQGEPKASGPVFGFCFFPSTTTEGCLQGWEPRTCTLLRFFGLKASVCFPPFRTKRERMGHPLDE